MKSIREVVVVVVVVTTTHGIIPLKAQLLKMDITKIDTTKESSNQKRRKTQHRLATHTMCTLFVRKTALDLIFMPIPDSFSWPLSPSNYYWAYFHFKSTNCRFEMKIKCGWRSDCESKSGSLVFTNTKPGLHLKKQKKNDNNLYIKQTLNLFSTSQN